MSVFNEQMQKAKEDLKKAKIIATQSQASGDPQKIQQANEAATNAADQADQANSGSIADQINAEKAGKTSAEPPAENKPAENKPAEQKPAEQKQNGDNVVRQQIRAGRLSDSFYRDLSAGLKGKPTGNTLDAAATTAVEQSANQQRESGNRSMESQAHQQIADQNVYSEADKEALHKQEAENRQNVRKAGVLGPGAAFARSSATSDVQGAKTRSDAQRSQAELQREKGDIAQQGATESSGQSMQFQLQSRDMDEDLNESGRLSEGEGAAAEPEQPAQEEPVKKDEPAKEPEQAPTPEQPSMPSGNPQHVINALLGSSKGQDLRSGQDGAADKELYDWAISQGVTPIQAGQHKNENDVNSWEQEFIANNGEAGQNVMQQLRQGRAGEGNDASKNFDASNMAQMNKSMTIQNNPPSDVRVKNLKQCLCDARMKWIKEDFDRDGKCSREDFDWLLSQLGNTFDYNGTSYDNQNDEGWDDSVLKAYAEHIRNYVYTYKPEATQIDSSIDPNQEHIGPMAQDIEQVNPACVHETPEGVKTVDTARLAMMNAGAIADLARQFQEMADKLKTLGV